MDFLSKSRRHFRLALLTLALLSGISCDILEVPEELSNPMDPTDPRFEPPSVQFTEAPDLGETVDTSHVLLAWTGNQRGMSFTYRKDNDDWSEWTDDTSTTYPYLDEGAHTFQIKSRYSNGVASQGAQSLFFEIDDIQGPAMRFFPLLIGWI